MDASHYFSLSKLYRWAELLLLFIVLPIILAIDIPLILKLILAGVGILYVIIIVIKHKLYKQVFSTAKPSFSFIRRLVLVASLLLVLGAAVVYYVDPDQLFSMVRNKPHIWILILFVYGFLSVVPQELVYRHYFFHRYEYLFRNRVVLLFFNAICFSLCHLFLWNATVLFLTFCGGILFAITYTREENMTWVCLEHTLYGYLIFTVGAGEMLAFPT